MAEPALSVVIPVHNAASTLARCLEALGRRDDVEVIVVDDGSTDGSGQLAASHGCRVLPTGARRGPAAARNRGAQEASSPLILFVDADVVVPPGAIQRVLDDFATHPEVAAVQSIYRCPGPHSNPSSRYQNDYYHYFCRRIPGIYTSVFATWCAGVRKGVFLELGGFDERIPDPSVEDEEFGYELMDRGYRILLDRSLEVEHLARYTLPTFLKRRFCMARSQMKSVLRKGAPRLFRRYANLGHNLTHHSRRVLCCIPLGWALPLLWAWTLSSARLLGISLAATALFLALGGEFFRFVVRTHGWGALPATVAIFWLDMLALGAGLGSGFVGYLAGRRY